MATEDVQPKRKEGAVRVWSRRIVLGVGILLLAVSLLAGYAQVLIISNSGFADHATAALEQQSVQTALSQAIVARLLQNAPPKLQISEPILQRAVESVVGSTGFQKIFRASLARTHQVLLSEHSNQIVLNLSKQAPLIVSVLSTTDPALASRLSAAAARLKQISQKNKLVPLIHLLHRVRMVEILAPIGSVLCFLIFMLLSTDRRRALRNVGIAIAAPAAVIWLLLAVGQWLAPFLVSAPLSQALPGIWEALLSGLRRWSLIVFIAGLAVVAIADASSSPGSLRSIGEHVRSWTTAEEPSRWRNPLLGVGAVLVGLLVVFEPLALVRLLLVVAGGAAFYWGVYAVLSLLTPATIRVSSSMASSDRTVGIGRWSAVAVVALAMLLLWVRNVWTA